MPPTDAVGLVGVQLSTPYARMSRYPNFKAQVDQAMEDGRRSVVVSPTHFAFPSGDLLLDADFEAIPRRPPSGLKAWVITQLRRNPLAHLAC